MQQLKSSNLFLEEFLTDKNAHIKMVCNKIFYKMYHLIYSVNLDVRVLENASESTKPAV